MPSAARRRAQVLPPRGRVALWAEFSHTTGYDHLVKNALFFGGFSRGTLERLFPPPTYKMPRDLWFEGSGVLRFVIALWAAYYLAGTVACHASCCARWRRSTTSSASSTPRLVRSTYRGASSAPRGLRSAARPWICPRGGPSGYPFRRRGRLSRRGSGLVCRWYRRRETGETGVVETSSRPLVRSDQRWPAATASM
jgi:hypothetical protein